MTILNSFSEKKPLEEPLVQNEVSEWDLLPEKKEKLKDISLELPLPPQSYIALRQCARRATNGTTLCLLITALIVLIIGSIGGIYLYEMARARMHTMQGMCKVPIKGDLDTTAYNSRLQANHLMDDPLMDDIMNPEIMDDDYDGDSLELAKTSTSGPKVFFTEEFEIDIEYETYERVDVPDFSGGRRGRFIHDFTANKTGIIDLDGRRCFVMPLNRTRILPPHSLFDLFMKMEGGYYEVDTEVIRETMRVVKPPITDYKSVGSYIARECSTLPTYRLERMTSPVFKRSVGTLNKNDIIFTEFAGSKIAQYDIRGLVDEKEN